MISEIRIRNFKSIRDLTLKLGRVTVLIGENGSGKSNILESLAFAAGAATDKLDRPFLSSRGVRVTESEWMTSAFPNETDDEQEIEFRVQASDSDPSLDFTISTKRREEDNSFAGWQVTDLVSDLDVESVISSERVEKWLSNQVRDDILESGVSEKTRRTLAKVFAYIEKRRAKGQVAETSGLSNFVVYAPENTSLRSFDSATALDPLGAKGEGLLKLLQSFADEKFADRLNDLKDRLHVFGWFDDFILPSTEDAVRDRLQLKDRWLAPERAVFDQNSANEGFLYVLFYLTLLMSWRTPTFFALDNVDSALNPKLCSALMRQIAELAKKYNKQVICTTHNPSLLDGLNINDDEQRLYSVQRDVDGHKEVNRVHPPKPQPGKPPMKLSAAFLAGHIGGLPEHF